MTDAATRMLPCLLREGPQLSLLSKRPHVQAPPCPCLGLGTALRSQPETLDPKGYLGTSQESRDSRFQGSREAGQF